MPGKGRAINLHFAKNYTVPVSVQFDLEDAGLPSFIPLDLDGSADGNIDLRADFTAGFGIDLDSSSANVLEPFVASNSKFELSADVDLTLNATASIGGLKLAIVDGVIKLKDSIDLGDDGAVGRNRRRCRHLWGSARLALTWTTSSPGDGRIYFTDLAPRRSTPTWPGQELLVNLPIEIGGTSFDPIFVLATINDFSDFDFTISGLSTDLVDEIINGLTELNLENLVAGFELLWNVISSGLQSDLVGNLPLVGEDLCAVGAELEKVKTEFIDPFLTYVQNLADD